VTEQANGVVESLDDLDPGTVFAPHRDQVILAVRIAPVFNTLDLGLVAAVIDAANQAGFALVRERTFRDEWLLCVFDAYDDHDPDGHGRDSRDRGADA
jgi:hypothetical protein